VQGNEIGVLYCCGKRLIWERQEGTSVMEVTCPKCGTVYAMDRGEDEEEGN
jgi:phage FluMu protein Com